MKQKAFKKNYFKEPNGKIAVKGILFDMSVLKRDKIIKKLFKSKGYQRQETK